ncbi:MAG TPA: adenylosuccinate lyase [Terriglobia bacterium]|nr:adenylosuccinate lyase [Terriglobia bacterium]
MITRYTRPEMGKIWSDQNKFQKWLDVELATAEAEAEIGMIPVEAARALREKSKFNVDRILEIEKQVKHDVIAFTTNVAESVGAEARYLHYGLTSNDVVDTAQALQIHDASKILLADLERLSDVLKKRAHEFKHTPMMGRTHGIHAEPITLGCKIAIWYAESQRNRERLKFAAEQLRVGKISGVVGMYGHSTPELEERICAKLGLAPALITSQVIQRDRHAFYVCILAVIAASLEKIALEVRGLQRTEVREVEEYFAPGQKGSSAMPHKRNPVTSEQICGLARVVRANAQAALENVALWHERDISHSSVERVILPDSTILADYLLEKTAKLVENMFVYPERMLENLNQMKGLIYSGQLLLDLVQKGVAREDAYQWVQRNAMKVWESREDFKTLVERDEDIRRFLSAEEIAAVFNVQRYLTHVDAMFKRVFGA